MSDLQLIKNISDSNISISYLDKEKHKIAVSEVSIMDKTLILTALNESITDVFEFTTMMNIANMSEHFGFYSRLNVPVSMRGNNIGSLLLDETLKVCAEKNIFLLNTINPYGDFSHDELLQFYERHGMTKISDEGVLVYSHHLTLLNNKRKNTP